MAQTPTQVTPVGLIDKFKGLNDQQDSTTRPPGTVTTNSNILDDEALDASRRIGRDMVSLDDGNQVQIILNLPWDDGGVSPVVIAGTVGSYDPITYPSAGGGGGTMDGVTDPGTPGPMPTEPSFLPMVKNNTSNLPDFTSYIRSLSELSKFLNAGTDGLSWPNRTWDVNVYDQYGTLIDSAVYDKNVIMDYKSKGCKFRAVAATAGYSVPADGTQIPKDFYWTDYFIQPMLMAYHLDGTYVGPTSWRSIRQNYNTVKNSFIKTNPVEGVSTLTDYGASDDIAATLNSFLMTTSTIMAAANNISEKINKLENIQVAASAGTKLGKAGEGTGYCASADSDIADLKKFGNERRVVAGIAEVTTSIPAMPTYNEWKTIIAAYTPGDLFTAGTWINTTTHPGGDISGSSSITYFSASDYTTEIADYTWFTLAYQTVGGHVYTQGTTGPGGTTVQVDGLNGEFCTLVNATITALIATTQKLVAITASGTLTRALDVGFTRAGITNRDGSRTCAQSKALAVSLWNASSWGNGGSPQAGWISTEIYSQYFDKAAITTQRGYITANLTSYAGCTCKLYLQLSPEIQGFYWASWVGAPATFGAGWAYQEWIGGSFDGGTSKVISLGFIDSAPSDGSDCPSDHHYGWELYPDAYGVNVIKIVVLGDFSA